MAPPLPRPKRTDPPGLTLSTDPRTWAPWRHAFGWAHRHFFPKPRAPFAPDHPIAPGIVAACVVREMMLALNLARFPRRRWEDWLCRRCESLYRLHRQFRRRLDGPHDRAYCHTYMRHWLYCGLRRAGWRYADCLPPDMWSGHSPLDCGVPTCFQWRLPRTRRGRCGVGPP